MALRRSASDEPTHLIESKAEQGAIKGMSSMLPQSLRRQHHVRTDLGMHTIPNKQTTPVPLLFMALNILLNKIGLLGHDITISTHA